MNRINDENNAFTYEKLYNTIPGTESIPLEEFKKYRFIYVSEEDEDYSGEIGVIYFHNDKYYWYGSYHCSCDGYHEWEPEEVDIAFIKLHFPDIDLDGSVINE